MGIHSRIHQQRRRVETPSACLHLRQRGPLAGKKCLCAGINLQKHRLTLLGLFIQIHRGENLNENKHNGVLSLSAEAVCIMIIIIIISITSLWRQMFYSPPTCAKQKEILQAEKCLQLQILSFLGAFVREFSWWISNQARGNNHQQEQSSSMYRVWHSWPAATFF